MSVSLTDVSFSLPDGRMLFSGLTETFGDGLTGLVGQNGIGKSVLAQVMAGRLMPTSGQVVVTG